MPQWIAQLGQQAVGGAVAGGMGMGFSRLASRYDRRMAKKMQDQTMGIQMAGEREMMNFQQDKELEMLGKSPTATVEGLKAAGLNPALMYGIGGGGGVTTGHGGSPGVSTGTPPKDTASAGVQAMGMGIQTGLQAAQIALLKAQTQKTAVETQKLGGVDTEQVKAQTGLTNVETEIKQVQASVARQTINEQMTAMIQQVQKNGEEIHAMQMNNEITEEQMQDRINILHTQALGAIIENEAKKEGIQVMKAEINKMAADIQQKWEELKIRNEEKNIKAYEATLKGKYPGLWNVFGRILNDTGNQIGKLMGEKAVSEQNPKK